MTLSSFQFALPGRVIFGRAEARNAPALIRAFGARGVLVHGANPARAEWLRDALRDAGAGVSTIACGVEPTLPMLETALAELRDTGAEWVVALGGGAVLDMGKALAALIPAPGGIMDHLEVVGLG
ncbi:MAG TPA: iron-containing alcohol dehydrogenase, partial [Paracoccus sp. (in: a-proteobacteria)]|nr:iron-containing alcohol dehydrogenase [Paracoccus sp. (in: a-proteobacteria)]